MLAVLGAIETEPLAAQTVIQLGPLGVTNSMLFGALSAGLTLGLLGWAASKSRLLPLSRLSYYIESLVGFILDIAVESFGSRRKALIHLPFLATLFTFIFISNLSGLIPGVGTIHTLSGGQEVSLLRPFTTDLNATLALAILTIGLVQFYAIRELGWLGHLKHYFSDRPWRPMNLFIGLNEVFSELLRIVTLSMRLFGVIYAGEVLIHAIAQLSGNFAWAATLPVIFLEIFFSAVQAYIFMMLTATYLSIATDSMEPVNQKVSAKAKMSASTATVS